MVKRNIKNRSNNKEREGKRFTFRQYDIIERKGMEQG